MSEWIKEKYETSLIDLCCGSTILIKFKDTSNGITADDNSTVDISWIRNGGDIIATTGVYRLNDIKEWKLI